MGRVIDTMNAADMKLSWARWSKGIDEEMCKPIGGEKGSENDLDRGNYDCQHGNQAREEESDAYYTGYGARYVYEQMANHHSEGANQ
jgi:hypothetical protein